MGMNALTARRAVADWMRKEAKANIQWNKEQKIKEDHITLTLWKRRGPIIVAQIDGYIKRASDNGKQYTYEPSKINPNGDSIIWLDEADRPIYRVLMDHYRKRGFTVIEYTPLALKIEW